MSTRNIQVPGADEMANGNPRGVAPAPSGGNEIPIIAFRGEVPADWIDDNGHVTSMAYPSLFHPSTGVLFRRIGIDRDYMASRRLSIFQREYHLCYDRELLEGSRIEIRSFLIAANDKRLHHFHELWNISQDYRAASVEYLSVHIDMVTRRSAPFPPDIVEKIDRLQQEFGPVPSPAGVSRRIALP